MIGQRTRRIDVLNWYLVFRDARTGKYVSRLYAFLHPSTTISERRAR